jgi:ribonuclease P protein component
MKHGKRIVSDGLTLITQKNEQDVTRCALRHKISNTLRAPLGNARFAFIVSTKIDKRATVRNRIKRLMSEAVRLSMDSIKPGIDCVVIARRELVGLSMAEVQTRLVDLFRKAGI